MEMLKKYRSQISIGLVAVGIICLILAFFIFPTKNDAILWIADDEKSVIIYPSSRIAANWLQEAGIRLYPGDTLRYAGLEIPPSFSLPEDGSVELTFEPAYMITLKNAKVDSAVSFASSAATLGEALWEQGILIKNGDKLSLSLSTPLVQSLDIELSTGRQVLLKIGDEILKAYSAATTVEGVLTDAGIHLQGLDFTKPHETEPVPADGRIEVIRVSEEILLENSEIPYSAERVPDAQMAVGEERVLQSGQNGVLTTALRVRYENGAEVARETQAEWISKQPISQKTAYGTQVVVHTSPEGLNYWLTKEVYITTYHDTGSPTASGVWPYYGVIAVSPQWYAILKGTNIYVPGYGKGTVLDVCPGCAGKPWIDVFIPTDEYVSWSRTETVYFLAPPPPNFSGDLP